MAAINAPGGNRRTHQYPVLDKMALGRKPAPVSDALGRFTQKVDEKRRKYGVLRPTSEGAPKRGGMPAYRGPGNMVPYLRRAASMLGLPPTAANPAVLQQIRRMGTTPQAMARQLGTSDPLRQAVALLRNRGIR